MTYYAPSVAVDPVQAAPSIISQPTSQAVVLADPSSRLLSSQMQYPATTAITIPTGRNSYGYGSYMQPVQYGYPQSMPMYSVQPQQQVVYTMPSNGYGMHGAYPSYGGYGMQMGPQYLPGMGGTSVVVQDPYGYHRRRSRRRRHSYGYGYGY